MAKKMHFEVWFDFVKERLFKKGYKVVDKEAALEAYRKGETPKEYVLGFDEEDLD